MSLREEMSDYSRACRYHLLGTLRGLVQAEDRSAPTLDRLLLVHRIAVGLRTPACHFMSLFGPMASPRLHNPPVGHGVSSAHDAVLTAALGLAGEFGRDQLINGEPLEREDARAVLTSRPAGCRTASHDGAVVLCCRYRTPDGSHPAENLGLSWWYSSCAALPTPERVGMTRWGFAEASSVIVTTPEELPADAVAFVLVKLVEEAAAAKCREYLCDWLASPWEAACEQELQLALIKLGDASPELIESLSRSRIERLDIGGRFRIANGPFIEGPNGRPVVRAELVHRARVGDAFGPRQPDTPPPEMIDAAEHAKKAAEREARRRSQTVIRDGERTIRPCVIEFEAAVGGLGWMKPSPKTARPGIVRDAHLYIGEVLAPMRCFADPTFCRDADRESLAEGLLSTVHFVRQWADEFLPKFRLYVLPVSVGAHTFESYHDAVWWLGSEFAAKLEQCGPARNLGETTWEAYYAAVAAEVAHRWSRATAAWEDNGFAAVDWDRLTLAFREEGELAIKEDTWLTDRGAASPCLPNVVAPAAAERREGPDEHDPRIFWFGGKPHDGLTPRASRLLNCLWPRLGQPVTWSELWGTVCDRRTRRPNLLGPSYDLRNFFDREDRVLPFDVICSKSSETVLLKRQCPTP